MITDEMLRAAWAAWDAHPSPPKDNAWWRDSTNYDKYLDAQLRAALEAAERAAWQPVETAPHDTPVLLGWYYNNEWICEVGAYSWDWQTAAIRDMPRHRHATHWRPLPELPETAP